MSPFLCGFKCCINRDLGISISNSYEIVKFSEQSKKDMLIWAGFLSDKIGKFPVASRPSESPIRYKQFTSDAAGWADSAKGLDRPGVASVGYTEEGELCFAYRHVWDRNMVMHLRDENNCRFGNKTAFLEMIGLLLPFILEPETLRCQHVVFCLNNISVVMLGITCT
jgi:hypothetical protein